METSLSLSDTPARFFDPSGGDDPLAGRTALVVDDEPAVRRVIVAILKKAHMTVHEAPDGRAALESLDRQRVDVLITDLVMPNAEGNELIIEARQRHPHTPIVAISGQGRRGPDNFLDVARLLGAVRTVAKPFAIRDLLDAVRDALSARVATDLQAEPPSERSPMGSITPRRNTVT